MAGYYSARGATGVHDDLQAKAVVLEASGGRAALVVCDLITMTRGVTDEARALIEKETGIAGERVMISATHSHTGPVIPSQSSRDAALGGDGESALKYRRELPLKIAEAVRRAAANLQPVTVLAGEGHVEDLAFNRRYFMQDGSVGWNPGKLNPKVVKPAGLTDPRLPVVSFATPRGKPLAAYVNFAMHLDTVGGTEISADYAGSLSATLEKVQGAGYLTIFSIGTAGDINHLDVHWRDPQKGQAEAARIATILAGQVLQTLKHAGAVGAGRLHAARETVPLPLAKVSEAEVARARELAAQYGTKAPPKFIDSVFAFKALDVSDRGGRPLEAEVQVIALGSEVAWVALPGEIFVELGLAIQKASPFPHTVLVELANGSVGYVPSRSAYPQGNYEVISARCGVGSGELLVESAIRLLKKLHDEK